METRNGYAGSGSVLNRAAGKVPYSLECRQRMHDVSQGSFNRQRE
jgi:hypothetical protein